MTYGRKSTEAGFFAALLAAAFAIGTGCRTRQSPSAPSVSSLPLAGVTVVLDPGHGGEDTGAVSGGVYEATVNYRMASTVASVLATQGAQVVFTVRSAALLPDLQEKQPEPDLVRPTDACLVFNASPVRLRPGKSPDDLYRRAVITRSLWNTLPENVRSSGRGIYFLSLHCDKLSGSHGHGARVYCDEREHQASRFAQALKRRLTDAGLTNSPGGIVIPRGYGVLNPRYNCLPERALVEVATISNPQDRRNVQTATWRWRMAHILVAAITECEGK